MVQIPILYSLLSMRIRSVRIECWVVGRETAGKHWDTAGARQDVREESGETAFQLNPCFTARLIHRDGPAIWICRGSANPVEDVPVVGTANGHQFMPRVIWHALPAALEFLQRPDRIPQLLLKVDRGQRCIRLVQVDKGAETSGAICVDDGLVVAWEAEAKLLLDGLPRMTRQIACWRGQEADQLIDRYDAITCL